MSERHVHEDCGECAGEWQLANDIAKLDADTIRDQAAEIERLRAVCKEAAGELLAFDVGPLGDAGLDVALALGSIAERLAATAEGVE